MSRSHGLVAVGKPAALSRRDKEFLPGALEILETPPSPVQTILALTICALVAVALVWCYVGKIDIIAVAQGKIQPIGRAKVIQPLEAGKVQAISVEVGSRVSAGDVLVVLDAGEAKADELAEINALATFKAEIRRREVVLVAAKERRLSPVPKIDWGSEIPADLAAREQHVLDGDLGALGADIASLAAEAQQKIVEADRKAMTIVSEQKLIATLKQRVDMRSTLAVMNVGSKASLIDSEETLQVQGTYLQSLEGEEDQARAGIEVVKRNIEKTYEKFIADNGEKLANAERQKDQAQDKLDRLRIVISHSTLKSPIAGVVQALAITTPGQVVTQGEEVMQIVPEDAGLEIQSYLLNTDIGFVKRGDAAQVKVDSFPFTRYGTIEARVVRVAKDAMPAPDAQQLEGNPAAAAKTMMFGGGERTQNLVFPVTLALESKAMNIDGTLVPFVPGMAVTVEIKTGRRRILEYLFSPLVEVVSTAGKER